MPKFSVLGRRRPYCASSLAAFFVLAVLAACSGTDRPPAPAPVQSTTMDSGDGVDSTTPLNTIDSSVPPLSSEASADATGEAALEAATEDAASDGPLDAAIDTASAADAGMDAGIDAGMEASGSDSGCTSAGNDADLVLMMCGGRCINVDTDPANCGGCNQTCGAVMGSICDLGTCKCPDPQVDCSNKCVDTSLDSSNCGVCGHNCQGDMCVMGLCQANRIAQVTVSTAPLADIAVDSTMIYWTQGFPAAGTYSKSISSSVQTTARVFANTNDPRGVVVNLTSVFWTDFSDGSVNKADLIGGGPTFIVPPSDPEAGPILRPLALTVDANNVYWVDATLGTVNQVSLHGGAITTLASGRSTPRAIAVDAASVYWVDYGSLPNTGSVNKVPIGQQSPITPLAISENQPSAIAVDATHVYWTDRANPSGTVKSVPIGGGAPKILAQNQGAPAGIAVDSQYVYWTNYDDNTVSEAPIAGGKSYVIASGQSNPSAIVVNDKNVFWANQGDGSIYKVAK